MVAWVGLHMSSRWNCVDAQFVTWSNELTLAKWRLHLLYITRMHLSFYLLILTAASVKPMVCILQYCSKCHHVRPDCRPLMWSNWMCNSLEKLSNGNNVAQLHPFEAKINSFCYYFSWCYCLSAHTITKLRQLNSTTTKCFGEFNWFFLFRRQFHLNFFFVRVKGTYNSKRILFSQSIRSHGECAMCITRS